ncbi:MAG: hypothetical protein V1652_02000 [bacterium]
MVNQKTSLSFQKVADGKAALIYELNGRKKPVKICICQNKDLSGKISSLYKETKKKQKAFIIVKVVGNFSRKKVLILTDSQNILNLIVSSLGMEHQEEQHKISPWEAKFPVWMFSEVITFLHEKLRMLSGASLVYSA